MLRPHFRKKSEAEETGVVTVGDVKIDAESAEIVYVDPDKDIQVVVSDDPENKDGAVVAVLTASAEDVEDEKVLGSANVEPEGEDKAGEEARKAEARKRFRARFEARQKAKKKEEAHKRLRERLAARRARASKAEARNSGWSEEDSEFCATFFDPGTTREEIKDQLKDDLYFEDHPYELDEVVDEIFALIPKAEKCGKSEARKKAVEEARAKFRAYAKKA